MRRSFRPRRPRRSRASSVAMRRSSSTPRGPLPGTQTLCTSGTGRSSSTTTSTGDARTSEIHAASSSTLGTVADRATMRTWGGA